MIFLATFISGFHQVVEDILDGYGVRCIHCVWDGVVIYENQHFVNAACFNNTFEVLHSERAQGKAPLDAFLRDLLRKPGQLKLRAMQSKRAISFRLVTSQENTLVAVDPQARRQLESLIQRATQLSLNKAKADIEFWLYARSEGHCFLMRRITRHRIGENQLEKGELRPELAYLMNWLSDPQKNDVYFDPFCGSGALPLSRAQHWGFARMHVSDIDPAKVDGVRRKFGEHRPQGAGQIDYRAADVLAAAEALPPHSVSKVVTDPPWGFFEQCDVPALYARMMRALLLAAKPGAVIVLLTAQREELERALARHPEEIEVKWVQNILVSGKKAAVYTMVVR